MITLIRRKLIQNKSYKYLVWAIGIVLALSLGLPGMLKQTSDFDQWVVNVNGVSIGYNDFARKVVEYDEQLRHFKQLYGEQADLISQAMGVSLNPHDMALDAVIRNALLNQVANTTVPRVHQASLDYAMTDALLLRQELSDIIPSHMVNSTYGVTVPQLKKHLRRQQLTLQDFEAKVVEAIQRSLVKEFVVRAIYIPEFELRQAYMQQGGKKDKTGAPLQEDYQEKIAPLARQIQQEKARVILGSFIASLHRTATIKQNDLLINAQKEYSI